LGPQTIFTYLSMANSEEQNFQNELRQAQISSANQPAEEDEEATSQEPETLESSQAEQAAQTALMGKKRQAAAQKRVGQGIKLTGRAQQAASFILRQIGTILVSFGIGMGITIIGLIIGLPLLLLGIGFLALGLFSAVTARITLAIGETMVEKAKKEEKSVTKAGGGGIAGAVRGAGETMSKVKKTASIIAAPFIYVGCTILGFLSGFILIAIIVASLFA
jgi:hypothetical protein